MAIGDGKPYNPPWWNHGLGAKRREPSSGWWKELGHEVPSYRKNQADGGGGVKELDRDWYDPPVKEGVSLSAINGLDTRNHRNLAIKNDQPGDLYDFQKKIMKDSIQYKQIAQKFDIHDEHPGIAVSPNLKTLHHFEPYQLGKSGPINSSLYHLGPRFWNKPLNEGCLEKGLCLVKYVALANFCFTGYQLKAFPKFPWEEHWNSRFMFQTYLRNLPVPAVVAFSYGVGLCFAADIRNADDYLNFWIAGALSGATLSAMKNIPMGVTLFLSTSLLAGIYQLARTTNAGFGRSTSQELGGFPIATGPMTWKFYRGKNSVIPERTHF